MQIHRHLPWQTSWQESVIIFLRQRERNIFKRKYIKLQTLPISFLSPARLCHTLIHLFPRSIMHVDPSTPAAPLGTTVSYLLSLPENTCCLSSEHELKQALVFFKTVSRLKCLLMIIRCCTLGLSQDRCLSAGSVEHQRHTGVLIRHQQ